MHPDKFGDSYDFVKRGLPHEQHLLQWLSDCGEWAVHPMLFTKRFQPCHRSFLDQYSRFLGAPPLEAGQVDKLSDKDSFVEVAKSAPSHLFLDPDTGLQVPEMRATSKHLKAEDLVEIAEARKDKLTLVFDQSRRRRKEDGSNEEQARKKLKWLKDRRVRGVVYCSHANFVLVSKNGDLLEEAKRTLLGNPRGFPTNGWSRFRRNQGAAFQRYDLLQDSPPGGGEHVGGNPVQHLARMQEKSRPGPLAVLSPKGAQMVDIPETRPSGCLDFDG